MNFLLGALGANLTLGLISGVTSAANGVYTLTSNIISSTATGANEVRQIIKETDLEVKIRTVQFLLCEVKVNSDSPYTLQYCVQCIKDVIKDISDELETIHYRMQYNDNIWLGSTVRAYRFHNCKARLVAHLKTLESRQSNLIEILKVQSSMTKNPELENDVSKSVLVDKFDAKTVENIRKELQTNLEFMRTNMIKND